MTVSCQISEISCPVFVDYCIPNEGFSTPERYEYSHFWTKKASNSVPLCIPRFFYAFMLPDGAWARYLVSQPWMSVFPVCVFSRYGKT